MLAGAEHCIAASNEGVASLAVSGAVPHAGFLPLAIVGVGALGEKNSIDLFGVHVGTSLKPNSERSTRRAQSQKPQFFAQWDGRRMAETPQSDSGRKPAQPGAEGMRPC